MSRSSLIALCAALACTALVPCAARADLIMQVTLHDGYGDTNGGEFIATPHHFDFIPVSPDLVGDFETFCVEKEEHIEMGETYFVQLNDRALGGGAPGGDPLDARTAYLYQKFATGTLTDYVYDASLGDHARGHCADALQHVIWYIEDEEAKSWHNGDGSLEDRFYRDARDHAGEDIGQVRVMNLWKNAAGTCHAQDQLVRLPEPASVALLALGLLAVRRLGR
jgi:hypothetical protein